MSNRENKKDIKSKKRPRSQISTITEEERKKEEERVADNKLYSGGKRTRRRRRKRGAVRTKHNTPKVFDPKTMKVIPNPHYKKPKKPSPITLNVQGQQVPFSPKEVEQQRKMLTQLKKLSPASSSKAFQLGSFNPQTNKGGRRKKGTKRRTKSRKRGRRRKSKRRN